MFSYFVNLHLFKNTICFAFRRPIFDDSKDDESNFKALEIRFDADVISVWAKREQLIALGENWKMVVWSSKNNNKKMMQQCVKIDALKFG